MAASQGYLASVGWTNSGSNSYVLNAYNWTLTYEAGEGETTDFTVAAATYPKEFLPLTSEWSGTASLRWDADIAIPAFEASLNNIRLYVDTTGVWGFGGSCFCTLENPTMDVNGVAEGTVNFRGSGALTIGALGGLALS